MTEANTHNVGGPHPPQSRLHSLKRLLPQRKGILSAGGLQTQTAALLSISSLCPLSECELSILPDRTDQLLKTSSSVCPHHSSASLEEPDDDDTVSTGPKRVRRWNSVLSARCVNLRSHPLLASSTQVCDPPPPTQSHLVSSAQ